VAASRAAVAFENRVLDSFETMRNRTPLSPLKNGFLKALVAAPLAIGASLYATAPASAASMTGPISGWQQGTEPSYISMYEYIPATVATNPPIVVMIHYCGGNAAGILGEGSALQQKADQAGFIIVLPQESRNCWDVATTPSLTHVTGTTAGGDTKAIVDMVHYSAMKHNANLNRVYAIGSSSGAMMTEALLAVYPDVFKAGAEFAGVPAGCWSASYTDSNQWSGPCAGGTVSKTAQQWGDLVRGMYPGYNGFRPRIQLWHGTADSTINYNNQTEAVKQWTNVMGLTGNGTSTTVSISSHSYTRVQWTNSCNQTVLDEWSEQNGPHGTDANMNGTYTLPFFNLDTTPYAATDPQAGCGTTTGTGGSGGSGAGGTTGAGGSGTGGATGTGGRGGTTGTGGTNPQGTGGTNPQGTGGTNPQGTGGTNPQGTGGTNPQGTGGSNPQGTGGSSTQGSAGSVGTGTGGSSNPQGTGGSSNTGTGGDATGAGGTSPTGTGGNNSSGSAGDTGQTGTGNSGGGSQSGWGCAVAGGGAGAVNALVLAGIFLVVLGRRRPKKRAADRR
jgi:acetylxylan esterase